jgi:hypothetical protein
MGATGSKKKNSAAAGSGSTARTVVLGSPADVSARLARARKLHSLDLSRCAALSALPPEARELPPLRRLDVSHTALRALPLAEQQLSSLAKLDQLDASSCALAGAQPSLLAAAALTQLRLGGNSRLAAADLAPPSFALPPSLRALSLAGCASLGAVPRALRGAAGAALLRLERLDLSGCGLHALPASLRALGGSLLELAVDDNGLASLALVADGDEEEEEEETRWKPADGGGSNGGAGAEASGAAAGGVGRGATASGAADAWERFTALTTLSARRCRLECSPAALPEALLARTKLSSLALGGNAGLSAATVLRLPGCEAFAARRAARISKGMTSAGDADVDRSFCGLDR